MKVLLLITFLCANSQNIHANRRCDSWQKSHYIWNFGLISACDKGVPQNPYAYFSSEPLFNARKYSQLKAGDVVWLKCVFVPDFCEQVLPDLKVPIILVISDGDESFPSECAKRFDCTPLLNNQCIMHIFAQNYDCSIKHANISHIPIGMDFHTVAYRGGRWGEWGSVLEQEACLESILKKLHPTRHRKKRIYVDFHLSDSMLHGELHRYLQCGEDRTSIFEQLKSTGLIDYGQRMRRSELWQLKGEYAFSVSPHGNGLDCHRTWEDLILGCIVIVKTSPLDALYEGLPVVIVKDWSEITAENLDLWLKKFGDAFNNRVYREKLTRKYWLSKILFEKKKIL